MTMARKSYKDLRAQQQGTAYGTSVFSQRYTRAHRAFANYAMNTSKAGANANTKVSRSTHMGLSNG